MPKPRNGNLYFDFRGINVFPSFRLFAKSIVNNLNQQENILDSLIKDEHRMSELEMICNLEFIIGNVLIIDFKFHREV